jgi:hypothetical protein
MPRFRATSARLEFARRLAVAKLCQHFRYEWTQADQAIFDFALSRTMRNEPWQSSRDIATYIFGFFYYYRVRRFARMLSATSWGSLPA